MPINNPDVKAEQECMTAIVDALTKLYKHYYGDNGDSVAEAQAINARARVLQWVVNFFIRGGYVGKVPRGE